MQAKIHFHSFSTPEQLSLAAAKHVARLSAQAVAARGRFTVALSGGSLIKLLGPAIVAEPWRDRVDWSKWHVFWADERCVPLTNPESNYYLAQKYLLAYVNLPPAQIYPLDDSLDPQAAAEAYQNTLAQVFSPGAGRWPCFDLILLGLGEDGHTASLFPQHALLNETERWVAAIFDSPKPPPERITLTLPVINHARQVVFITAGPGKAEALAQVFDSTLTHKLPAQLAQPINGEAHWFVDEAAAADLPR
ncbi:MAG: 6-phosphogluconolactonase [Anaerolineae bacterium]|nr:6-phosphogluconolactonase [Anaerolineae bacterium]